MSRVMRVTQRLPTPLREGLQLGQPLWVGAEDDRWVGYVTGVYRPDDDMGGVMIEITAAADV